MVPDDFVTGVPNAVLASGLFGCVLLVGIRVAVRLTGRKGG
jgi:hypothetical protein